MTTTTTSLLAIFGSLCCLLALAKANPKRHRTQGSAWQLPARAKSLLVVLSLVPGVVLCFMSMAPSFLVWLGAITIAGWVVAMLPEKII